MIDVPQDPEWHPEGNVWRHTLLVCDAAAGIAGKEQLLQTDVIVLLLSSLCHDVGKPVTADPERESIVPRQQRVLNRAMFDSPQFRGRSRSENA